MKLLYLIGTVMAAGTVSQAQKVGVRAPARLTIEDCLCQCDSQVFVDKFGRTNGNCKSADSSGKKWCYLKDVNELIGSYRRSHKSWNSWTTVQAASPVSTTCRDGKTSQQFQGKVFGYHACGTPDLYSRQCQQLLNGGGNNGGGNNNCGSWNNYCNGNNGNNGGNNGCGSWNNYCNGNNGNNGGNNGCGSWNNFCNGNNNNNNNNNGCGSWNNYCNGNNNNNNNNGCGSWNNYCNNNNNSWGRGGNKKGKRKNSNRNTSTRNQSSKRKGGVSFVPQK